MSDEIINFIKNDNEMLIKCLCVQDIMYYYVQCPHN